MKQEWQSFWLAVGFLTRIPMPVKIDYSQSLMNRSSLYFPLVGLLLGGLYGALFAGLAVFWSLPVCIGLVLAFHLWITGAFHEDGLADSMDALGGGYTVARRLEIMKDSRIGTYGAVALIMALGLKGLLLADANPVWLALLLSPVISRLTPLWLMRFLPYVTDPDTGEWMVLRVPYPLGFFSRGLDGRIDDPDAGWKGKGLWATWSTRAPFHAETGKGTPSKVVRFQLRPDPLAK